ncbi:MAG: cell division protein FtsX [Acidimicrobiales bacterium]
MPISAGYLARETASNLWRNRLMTLAAILTVGVSLSLVGTALLLRQSVNSQLAALGNNVDIQIFMKPSASAGETRAVRTTAHETVQIKSCDYLDHLQSYMQAKALFAGQPQIVSVLTPATTPPVFQCTLVHPRDAAVVANLFTTATGVYKVTFPAQSIRSLTALSNVLQIVLFTVAMVLLLSAVVLILMAIRMAIFARRREVAVMRLVGATAWFIRLPFMVEGLVQGFIGALVAVGIVLLGDLGIRALLNRFAEFRGAGVPSHDVIVTEILVVVVGIVVGVVGSAVAVRRFLSV